METDKRDEGATVAILAGQDAARRLAVMEAVKVHDARESAERYCEVMERLGWYGERLGESCDPLAL